jgi:hypothetical protein
MLISREQENPLRSHVFSLAREGVGGTDFSLFVWLVTGGW